MAITILLAAKCNCLVDDSESKEKYKRIEDLDWSETELLQRMTIKVNKSPKDKKVKLFCVTVSANRTKYVVTNYLTQG